MILEDAKTKNNQYLMQDVYLMKEVVAAVSSSLDFWLTLGQEASIFENKLSSFLGVKSSLLVNSGSSANLLAISALKSWLIPDDRRPRDGDEVITLLDFQQQLLQ